jgi:hypothetical protein
MPHVSVVQASPQAPANRQRRQCGTAGCWGAAACRRTLGLSPAGQRRQGRARAGAGPAKQTAPGSPGPLGWLNPAASPAACMKLRGSRSPSASWSNRACTWATIPAGLVVLACFDMVWLLEAAPHRARHDGSINTSPPRVSRVGGQKTTAPARGGHRGLRHLPVVTTEMAPLGQAAAAPVGSGPVTSRENGALSSARGPVWSVAFQMQEHRVVDLASVPCGKERVQSFELDR